MGSVSGLSLFGAATLGGRVVRAFGGIIGGSISKAKNDQFGGLQDGTRLWMRMLAALCGKAR
jgi:hypothetical protein